MNFDRINYEKSECTMGTKGKKVKFVNVFLDIKSQIVFNETK